MTLLYDPYCFLWLGVCFVLESILLQLMTCRIFHLECFNNLLKSCFMNTDDYAVGLADC